MHRLSDRLKSTKTFQKDASVEISLRKQHEDELLNKRRLELTEPIVENDIVPTLLKNRDALKIYLPELYTNLTSHLPNEPMKILRKLITSSNVDDIGELVVQNNLHVPAILLLENSGIDVCLDAVWTILNLLSAKIHISSIIAKCGAIDALIKILHFHTNHEILENAVWALCNAAGDKLLSTAQIKTVMNIVPHLKANSSIVCSHNLAWFLYNNSNSVTLEIYEQFSSLVLDWLTSRPDMKCMCYLIHACTRLMIISIPPAPGSSQTPQLTPPFVMVMEKSHLYQMLVDDPVLNSSDKVMAAFAHFSGVLSRHKDDHLVVFSESGLLRVLLKCMRSLIYECRRKATWAFSNFAACSSGEVVREVIGSCNIFKAMKAGRGNHPILDVSYVYCNAALQFTRLLTVEELFHYDFLEGWRQTAEAALTSEKVADVLSILLRGLESIVSQLSSKKSLELLKEVRESLGECLNHLYEHLTTDELDLDVNFVDSGSKVKETKSVRELNASQKIHTLGILTGIMEVLGLIETHPYYGDDLEGIDFDFTPEDGL